MRRRTRRIVPLVAAFFLLPNLAIAVLHRRASRTAPGPSRRIPVENFAEVDDRLWRGAAPTEEAIEALAGEGMATVVDLRAEVGIDSHQALYDRLGVRRAQLPLRDGQAPTRNQVEQFLEVVSASSGLVFVHCGAGVGRTGTMAAAYLVATGQATGRRAVVQNLAVGPPSVEQLAFGFGLRSGAFRRPPVPVVVFSRAVDGPRRFWARVRRSYDRGRRRSSRRPSGRRG